VLTVYENAVATTKAVPLPTCVLAPNPDINVDATMTWIKVEPTPVIPNFTILATLAFEGVFE